jgi:hypothetical protein
MDCCFLDDEDDDEDDDDDVNDDFNDDDGLPKKFEISLLLEFFLFPCAVFLFFLFEKAEVFMAILAAAVGLHSFVEKDLVVKA